VARRLALRAPPGIEVAELRADGARLRLPFAAFLPTLADVVHGGAIGALIDTTAAAAVFAGPLEDSAAEGGATVDLTVQLLGAARGQDLTAAGGVRRRAGSVCFCAVDVSAADGTLVATGLVTYKLRG